MIRIIKSILVIAPLLTGLSVSAQSEKCEQNIYPIGVDKYQSRGIGGASDKYKLKDPNIKKDFEPGKYIMLPGKPSEAKIRGQKVCMITVVNAFDSKVHIYVDSLYEGTIDVGGFGFIKRKHNYSTVYCVTESGKRSWNVKGDCSCSYTYNLK